MPTKFRLTERTAGVYVALAGVAFVAWAIIWGWFAAVESDWAETDWWTERPSRLWIPIGISVLVPVVLGAIAAKFTSGRISIPSAALVAATTIALYTGWHEASPLEYDNGVKIVYPVFTNIALSVLGMGMLIPMALRWRPMFVGVSPGRAGRDLL